MKRGINCILSVTIGMNLDEIERIEFLFIQDDQKLTFNYPSQNALRDGNKINLIWTQSDTMLFQEGVVKMDTHVHLYGVDTNPETKIVSIKMSPTLFDEETLPDD